MNIDTIAKYIIQSGVYVDQLKLQKLLYYSEAISLFLNEKSLFSNEIKAWKYGPVVEDIYHKYKGYGYEQIERTDDDFELPKSIETIEPIDNALSLYGDMSGAELIAKTHSEDPWKIAFAKGEGSEITRESMREYFKNIYSYE